jgi:hypothetical protein
MMTSVLWPLGDTLEEAVTKPWIGEVAWDVDEVGTVFEVEYCMYASLQVLIVYFYHNFM